jgi:hypothetical protein
MTGRFLSQWEMAEAKRHEARANSIQKREGTNFPLSGIIAWGCGCCIGPSIRYDQPILSASEADGVLKQRKHEVFGHRIGWLDSARMPSRVHRTIDCGETTVCGHVPADNDWILAEVPRKNHGYSRYCRTCFQQGGKALPWLRKADVAERMWREQIWRNGRRDS